MNPLFLSGSTSWIFGLSFIAVVIGWRLWQLRKYHIRPNDTPIDIVLDVGALLFCLGISLTVVHPWARILFAILASAFAIIAIIDLRSASREHF